VGEIPGRLARIWDESEAGGVGPAQVADGMARELIGRG
jgi:leucine dehydrogenase